MTDDDRASPPDPVEELRRVVAALTEAEGRVAGLRAERDRLIGQVATVTRFGYKRIARLARVSTSWASRIAREHGAPPRFDTDDH